MINFDNLTLEELNKLVEDANSALVSKKKTEGRAQAQKKINEHVTNAYKEIEAAQKLADEFGIEFEFSLGYGMGGTFYPAKTNNSDWDESDGWTSSYEGWVSSSSQC